MAKEVKKTDEISTKEKESASNETTKKSNNTRLIVILTMVLILAILAAIFPIAYSRYRTTKTAGATANVASMYCEMTVSSSQSSDSIINPYCTVTVMDYKNNKTTETDIDYTIEVKAKDDAFILPEFAWKDSNGTIIARSVDVTDNQGNLVSRTATFPTGHFKNGVKEDHTYTIVFFNTGEEEITRRVDFKLNAIQGIGE